MERDKLFLDYVEKHINYQKQFKEILIVETKIFLIKNDNVIYNYTELTNIIDEIKISMIMFGYEEIYQCENIGDNKKTFPNCFYVSSASTYSFNQVNYV